MRWPLIKGVLKMPQAGNYPNRGRSYLVPGTYSTAKYLSSSSCHSTLPAAISASASRSLRTLETTAWASLPVKRVSSVAFRWGPAGIPLVARERRFHGDIAGAVFVRGFDYQVGPAETAEFIGRDVSAYCVLSHIGQFQPRHIADVLHCQVLFHAQVHNYAGAVFDDKVADISPFNLRHVIDRGSQSAVYAAAKLFQFRSLSFQFLAVDGGHSRSLALDCPFILTSPDSGRHSFGICKGA